MSNLGRRELLTAALAGGAVPFAGRRDERTFPRFGRGSFSTRSRRKELTATEEAYAALLPVARSRNACASQAAGKIDMQYARSFEYLFRDYGYYWKSHLHSAGPIYDQGTIRALYAMSDATGTRNIGARQTPSSTFSCPAW